MVGDMEKEELVEGVHSYDWCRGSWGRVRVEDMDEGVNDLELGER